jgi:hypothetical protein
MASSQLGGPTFLFCGRNTLRKLPKLGNFHAVALTNAEAKRFSCALVALKGTTGFPHPLAGCCRLFFAATLAAGK